MLKKKGRIRQHAERNKLAKKIEYKNWKEDRNETIQITWMEDEKKIHGKWTKYKQIKKQEKKKGETNKRGKRRRDGHKQRKSEIKKDRNQQAKEGQRKKQVNRQN